MKILKIENNMKNTKIAQQHIKEKDYPSVDDISSYAEALKLHLSDGMIKDEELCRLIENLPSPTNIRTRLSNEEVKILFQTIGYLWKKITGSDPIQESKMESQPETLCGNYWMLQKGVLLFGPNHFTIIKQNLELFRSLLGINAFALHEKMSANPNQLIKLVIDHGAMRIFVNKNRIAYFQLTDETYGKWAKRKIRKYDFHKKIVKVIDKTRPYSGWRSGITILL